MLSYQHAYHAGNFADVLKHIVLCSVIDYMNQKEKPFYFHDTHAGRGLYALSLAEMQKLREYESGITKLWPLLDNEKKMGEKSFSVLAPYARALQHYNPNHNLVQYPGSGLFAQTLMRESDQLVLTELHPAEFESLQHNTRHLHNVIVKKTDAWEGLRAALPPRQKRGVILIDPSYELKNEHRQVINGVEDALKRFATGVYLIWYPIISDDNSLQNTVATKLVRGITKLAPPSLLQIEMQLTGHGNKRGLIGSGMLVINAPWQLDSQMNALLPLLLPLSGADKNAGFLVKSLINK